ncbi:hypothetical protein, partial [Candidatus Neomicrothrix sp.]|uniref:hypothetical protein n=1 Tax=Candidatus Neomicrothrix sp. TaxID=2719034 RepID=UPI002C491BA9
QSPAQGRQRSTPIARTGPIRLETCDRSHGTSLINTCDNQAGLAPETEQFPEVSPVRPAPAVAVLLDPVFGQSASRPG